MLEDGKGRVEGGSFRFIFSMTVVKERELDFEIGYPTDVKHVAHIGADGLGVTPPSWMNGFKASPDFSAPTLGSFKEKKSLNSKESKVDSPTAQKKHRRRKPKSTTSSPRASSRSSRTSRSKEVVEVEA